MTSSHTTKSHEMTDYHGLTFAFYLTTTTVWCESGCKSARKTKSRNIMQKEKKYYAQPLGGDFSFFSVEMIIM